MNIVCQHEEDLKELSIEINSSYYINFYSSAKLVPPKQSGPKKSIRQLTKDKNQVIQLNSFN